MIKSHHGVLAAPVHISPECKKELIQRVSDLELHCVAISQVKTWEETDKTVSTWFQKLKLSYQEYYPAAPIDHDAGFMVANSSTAQRETVLSSFAKTVSGQNILHVAGIIFLSTAEETVIEFPHLHLTVKPKPDTGLLFPCNWIYEPRIELVSTPITTITTFFGHG